MPGCSPILAYSEHVENFIGRSQQRGALLMQKQWELTIRCFALLCSLLSLCMCVLLVFVCVVVVCLFVCFSRVLALLFLHLLSIQLGKIKEVRYICVYGEWLGLDENVCFSPCHSHYKTAYIFNYIVFTRSSCSPSHLLTLYSPL